MTIRRSDDLAASEERILAALDEAAEATGHPFRMDTVSFEAWDGETWLGGIRMKAGMAWIFVELLAIAPEARGRGLGTALLQHAEREAVSRDLHGVWLDTFAFQAPDFYRRLSYTEFGALSGPTPPETRHFFAKPLRPGASVSVLGGATSKEQP